MRVIVRARDLDARLLWQLTATCLIWQVLAEIDRDRGPASIDLTTDTVGDGSSGDPVGGPAGSGTGPGPTLLVVRDSRAASTLRAVCRYGSKAATQPLSQLTIACNGGPAAVGEAYWITSWSLTCYR